MAEGKEEKELRFLRINSLSFELLQSPNPETKKLAELALLVGMDNLSVALRLLDLEKARHPSDTAQKQLNDGIVEYLGLIEKRLSELEKSPFAKDAKIEQLRAELQTQTAKFERHRQTLEDIDAWSRGRVLKWFRERFGGESPP